MGCRSRGPAPCAVTMGLCNYNFCLRKAPKNQPSAFRGAQGGPNNRFSFYVDQSENIYPCDYGYNFVRNSFTRKCVYPIEFDGRVFWGRSPRLGTPDTDLGPTGVTVQLVSHGALPRQSRNKHYLKWTCGHPLLITFHHRLITASRISRRPLSDQTHDAGW